jgi:transposase
MARRIAMPWNETCAMDEKVRFVVAYLEGGSSMTELCEDFGISRKTGYQVLARFEAGGFEGLAPGSKAPHQHGRVTPAALRAPILALRAERPRWGPKKLRAELARRQPEVVWPAASTIGELVGLRELASGDWVVRFFDYDLGVLERTSRKLRRFGPPRPGRAKANQTANTVTHASGP